VRGFWDLKVVTEAGETEEASRVIAKGFRLYTLSDDESFAGDGFWRKIFRCTVHEVYAEWRQPMDKAVRCCDMGA